MPFKKLTKKGENFITTSCGTGTDKVSGKFRYTLPYSNVGDKTFIANATFNGTAISNNTILAEALISWYNEYCSLYDIDANILAAQGFVESNYRMWAYSPTGALGITQFTPITIYGVIVANVGEASNVIPGFTTDEVNAIIDGITEPTRENSYYGKNPVALSNREILHQNIIDNPEIMIKAQCRYMTGISRYSDLAASCLFAYNQGPRLAKRTYQETVVNGEERLKEPNFEEATRYVRRIFETLKDGFGYNIDTSFDPFQADVSANIDNNLVRNLDQNLSKDFTLRELLVTSQPFPNVPTQQEVGKLRALAVNVLQPIRDLVGERVVINSAFRSEKVNNAVGGVSNSQHRLGEAADIRLATTSTTDLFDVYTSIINSNIPYDQIIFEDKGNNNTWIHISYTTRRTNRFEKLLATFNNGVADYTPFNA